MANPYQTTNPNIYETYNYKGFNVSKNYKLKDKSIYSKNKLFDGKEEKKEIYSKNKKKY